MPRTNLKIPSSCRMDWGSGNSDGSLKTPQKPTGVFRGEMTVALDLTVAAGVEETTGIEITHRSGDHRRCRRKG